MRRNGVILPAAVIAAIAVAGVSTAAWIMGPSISGATGAAEAIEAIPKTHTVELLEQERQEMIVMSEASRTLTVVAKPKMATPQTAMSSGSSSDTSASDGSAGSSGTSVPAEPPPAPGTAKSIAYNMLGSFGFSTSQFSCLDDLWTQESGWNVDAENASGAFGIPQALPGSRMASAGPDWQTDASTQIRWGLGYIQDTYGTPCAAWAHEEADNWY
jgi:hypothetical protein